MIRYQLWENSEKNDTTIDYYAPTLSASHTAVLIFAGGAYLGRSAYEDEGYAAMFNTLGMTAFVVNYRVSPHCFPEPLLDARRAVRFVRAHAEEFGIDKDKILVVGSSAGGHLAALLSTYTQAIEGEGVDETDKEEYMPNGQILCYPVICSDENIGHADSYKFLLGDRYGERDKFSPELLVSEKTPKAFLWHTSTDTVVSVINSYRYAEALAKNNVSCELHVFPVGGHGHGLSPHNHYVSTWIELMRKWLIINGFIDTVY